MSNRKTMHGQILEVLRQLKAKYPNQGVGKHLSEALVDYPNYWGLSDKEFLFALERYVLELEENTPPPEIELQQLIEESSSIDRLRKGIVDYDELDEEEEYGNEEE